MDKERLKAFALCNVDEFDDFFTMYEKDLINFFAEYLDKKRVYHICMMDFASLIFYKMVVDGKKFKKINVEELNFDEVVGARA